MITSIYTTNTWGHPERVAEVVNYAYAADLIERANHPFSAQTRKAEEEPAAAE